jgi:integrase
MLLIYREGFFKPVSAGAGLTAFRDMNKRHTLTKDERTGKHFARIQVGGTRKKFLFSKNYRKALQELRQLEADLESGKKSFAALANIHLDKSTPKDLKISELAGLYLDWLEANRAAGTVITARYNLKPFLNFFGDCMVSDLNTITLTRYYAWAKKNRGQSENGGNHHLRHVKTLLRWGEQMEICLCPVRRFPAIREMPARTKKFTDDELVRLLNSAADDFKDLIVFGLLTGLRPQELRGLRREHIRQGEPCWSIVLERHKTSRSAEIAQPRCIPLSAQAVTIIQRQAAAHPESDHIFLNDHGRPYKANGFRLRLKRACRRAGVEQKPPYALRHYFGTKRAAGGLNQTVLAQIMGHTKLQTTSRYIAPVPDYHQKAVEAMERDLAFLLAQTEPECKSGSKVVPKWPPLKIISEPAEQVASATH